MGTRSSISSRTAATLHCGIVEVEGPSSSVQGTSLFERAHRRLVHSVVLPFFRFEGSNLDCGKFNFL